MISVYEATERLFSLHVDPATLVSGSFLDQAGVVQIVDVASGQVQRLHSERVAPTLFRPGRPAWSADGKTIAVTVLRPYSTRFREGTSQILLLSVDDSSARVVTPLPHISIGKRENDGPAWSPDGSKMAFVAGGSLWMVNVDPRGEPVGALRQISADAADMPSWAGDSRRLLYMASDRLKLVSVDDGTVSDVPLNLEWRRTPRSGALVVHAGALFDGRSATLRRDVDIVIEGERIRAVQPHSAATHTGNVIDASGRTVMPGLIETHTHLSDDYGESLGRIWLSYGVLTVREPAGNPYRGVERREAIESGRRLGPRIFTTGYTFDGARIYYSGSMSIDGGPQLERELGRARDLGFDVVKTYVRLPDVLQKRVIDLAHRQGMPVTSHELYPAAAFGADGVEHIRGTSRRGYSTKVSALNRSYRDVIEILGASGMTITPTVGIQGAFQWIAAQDTALLGDRRFTTLFPEWIVESARASVEAARRELPAREARLRPLGQTVRAVVDAGGRVIAGTDAP
ncbi:MAG: amidohydrolase, partial [Gemmatimonadetes bacterium]|nr:amidohydrolase [Gemmatimonadota bacterium]